MAGAWLQLGDGSEPFLGIGHGGSWATTHLAVDTHREPVKTGSTQRDPGPDVGPVSGDDVGRDAERDDGERSWMLPAASLEHPPDRG